MAKSLNIAAELFILCVVCWCVLSAPIARTDLKKAASFFLSFGYLNKSDPNEFASASKPDAPSFATAVRNLQRFGGLPVTGELNYETIKLINTKRCGRDDPFKKLNNTRDARGIPKIGEYYLQGTYWRKKSLTYRFLSFTPGLHEDTQAEILRRMISKWEAASQLTITEADSSLPDDKVDILIRFVRGYHGDPYPFDGPGGTLAHAYYPHENKGLAGDAHFDDDEHFTTGTKDGINLDWVAVHEFGHSLGLEHSNVRESIMYPWYKGYFPNIELTYDDIAGIQALYGKPTATPSPTPKATDPRTTTASTTPTTTPTTTHPTITASHPGCQPDVEYDAVVLAQNLKTHFFKGHHFWTLSNTLRSKTAPKRVRDCWGEVETPVDAAYRNKKDHVVFFKGSKFWEYYSQESCPKRLHSQGLITEYGLDSSLANMDVVFTWKGNGKTYFFKDGLYWRFDEDRSSVDSGYPRRTRDGWPDFPNKLNAAVTWKNDFSYVFNKGRYYRLQKKASHRTVLFDSGYPRDIHKVWIRCQTKSVGALVGFLGATP